MHGPSRALQAVCRPLGKITFILFDPSQSKALLWEHMHERRLFVFFFIILFFSIIYCQWCNLACFTLCWTSWLGEAQHYASLPILSGCTGIFVLDKVWTCASCRLQYCTQPNKHIIGLFAFRDSDQLQEPSGTDRPRTALTEEAKQRLSEEVCDTILSLATLWVLP